MRGGFTKLVHFPITGITDELHALQSAEAIALLAGLGSRSYTCRGGLRLCLLAHPS